MRFEDGEGIHETAPRDVRVCPRPPAGSDGCRLPAPGSRRSPAYWLDLELKADAKLKRLDDFLRRIWLECCGYLSEFSIAEYDYVTPHAQEHESKCPEEAHFLPVVNSPRMGVCAYTGEL